MIAEELYLLLAEEMAFRVVIQGREIEHGVFRHFGQTLPEKRADEELHAREVGLEDAEDEIQILRRRRPGVGGSVAEGAGSVRRWVGGQVFYSRDLFPDALHRAGHEICRIWEERGCTAFIRPGAN